jgi:hypothetical protein
MTTSCPFYPLKGWSPRTPSRITRRWAAHSSGRLIEQALSRAFERLWLGPHSHSDDAHGRQPPERLPRRCRRGSQVRYLWSASRRARMPSSSSLMPEAGITKRPGLRSSLYSEIRSTRNAAPSAATSTAPGRKPSRSRSILGMTSRPALSMVARTPQDYRGHGTSARKGCGLLTRPTLHRQSGEPRPAAVPTTLRHTIARPELAYAAGRQLISRPPRTRARSEGPSRNVLGRSAGAGPMRPSTHGFGGRRSGSRRLTADGAALRIGIRASLPPLWLPALVCYAAVLFLSEATRNLRLRLR